MFSDGTFSDGTFGDGMLSDGTFCKWIFRIAQPYCHCLPYCWLDHYTEKNIFSKTFPEKQAYLATWKKHNFFRLLQNLPPENEIVTIFAVFCRKKVDFFAIELTGPNSSNL